MKQTQKYRTACEIATLDHHTHDELYCKLNELGFFWNSSSQTWERNEQLADPPSEVLRIRAWAETSQVETLAEIIAESLEQYGLKLIEKSPPYICRPPKQNDSRIYLTFVETSNNEQT